MALYRCKFVNSIAASPTTLLDLNDGVTYRVLQDGLDLSPPTVRRAKSGTILTPGDTISAIVAANRVAVIQLLVSGSSRDNLNTALSNLHAQLVKERNILEVRTGTASRFLRTFASPDPTVVDEGALNRARVTLRLEAEPYAYGLPVIQTGLAVANHPAAGTRPCFLDVTGVLGDVPTPAIVTITTPSQNSFAIGVRRHGTATAATPWFVQCEAFTLNAWTATGTDATNMSGAGANYVRATIPAGAQPMTLVMNEILTGLTVDHRGTYRVFLRGKRSTSNADAITVQFAYGGDTGVGTITYGPIYTTLASDTNRYLWDMGTMTIPAGADPVNDPPGVALGVGDVTVELYAARAAGSGSFLLDFDYLMFVPADEELTIATASTPAPTSDLVLDGDKQMGYFTASGKVVSRGGPGIAGAVAPNLTPGITNRLVILRNVLGIPTEPNVIGDTTTVAVTHLPRYLYL